MIQKSHIWNSFSENILSDIQSFYICPDVPVDIIRVFLISDFLAENLKANKKLQKRSHTRFTIRFCSKTPHSFYEHQCT